MHPLLISQLQEHLGQGFVPSPQWQAFMDAVDGHYQASDQAQGLLRSLMDAVPDMICLKSPRGVYRGCNRAFEEFIGQSETQLLGKTDGDLLTPAQASQARALDQEALLAGAGEQHFSEHWSVDPRGLRVYLAQTRMPYFDADGQLQGLVLVTRDATERQLAQEAQQMHSAQDPATGLPNRASFDEHLVHELKLAQRSKLVLAVLVIGLDPYQSADAPLAAETAQALLHEAGRRILDVVRETDTAAYLGEDQFGVLIPNLHDVTDIERIAQNIIRRLVEPMLPDGANLQLSASVGIALFPTNATVAAGLLANARQAMFFAQSAGRNRFSHYTFGLQQAATQRGRLSRDLCRAVDVRQFEIYYQPIVELATGRICKAEALLRWNHEGRGQILPLDFVPLAEDNGAIIDIGNWMFREAAQQLQRLRAQFQPDFSISLNASPVQLRSNRATPGSWFAVLAELGLPGDCITLELTEGVLRQTEDVAAPRLRLFREAGFKLAIDDFGVGFASLSQLRRFEVDYLKIDRSFIRELESNPNDQVLCEAIVAMAHKLGIQVIAEGVESADQQALLRAAGCDYAQGYLYAHPQPAAELELLLARTAPASASVSA